MVFALAGISALANWIAVARKHKRLEYLAKPMTTVLLLIAALTLTPDDPTQRGWFVAALVLCLAGDVFLMAPRDLFVPGLASFLLGHLAFIGGLIAHGLQYRLGVAVAAVVVMGVLARPVIAAVRRSHADLLAPVVAYIVVIGAMLLTSSWTDSWVGFAGGAMFVASDRILAHNRFITPLPYGHLATMVTYHAALALLVLSLR